MPIQFRCPACGQPIEVDDEAAHHMVLCPFCKATNPAPTVSDPNVGTGAGEPSQSSTSVAAPMARFDSDGLTHVPSRYPQERRVVCGWLALASIGLSAICFLICLACTLHLAMDQGPNLDVQRMQQQVQDLFQEKPWLFVVNLIMTLAPFAALALGIASLVIRERPKWPAVVSLSLCGAFVLLLCFSIGAMIMLS